jgi:TRAP transporter 4TM/12TM fusion protein
VESQALEQTNGKRGPQESGPVAAVAQSRYRVLTPFPRYCSIALTVVGTAAAVIYLFHIGVSIWGEYVVGTAYLHLVLALFLPQIFIHFPLTSGSREKLPWYDVIFVLLSFIAPFYFFLNGENILFTGWEIVPPPVAFWLGIILWALVLEGARRTVGWFLFFLVLAFSLYPLFASHMPGLFYGKSFGFVRVVGYNIMGPEGVIGLPTRVLGNLFIGFMLFGVALTATGAASFFLNLALSLLGTVRGGTAKVSVISSAMVGSISGSVITNVITTGSFTIPAMKRAGYPNYYAAAIETCASSGGVLMPPIMGAAAFVMAGILNISYAQVALAAAVPSILYYLGLFVQVDGFAARQGLKGLTREELPSFWQTVKEGWFYLLAFAVLIYVLFILRREAQAPFYATIPLLLLTMIRKETRLNFKDFLGFLERVGRVLGEITGILSSIGLLIGALLLTGTAQTLSTDLIDLAGGNVFLLVGMGALASFILGMGLTITACYLLLAVLLAPALVQLGFYDLAVHIFLIYTGVLSFITPPVAIGAYAAAALAGSNPMITAVQAVRLGAVKYIIPFFVIFEPALILHGSFMEIFQSVGTAVIGVIFLGSGIEGYLVFVGRLGLFGRACTLIGGFLIFMPGSTTNFIGAGIIAILFTVHFLSPAVSKEKYPDKELQSP